MKVRSFIEMWNQPFSVCEPFYSRFKLGNFGGLYKIYAQPFKPEMICKFFEGFRELDEYNFIDDNGNIIIQFSDDYNSVIYKLNHHWFYPLTLDDFINDCARASIELSWRVK